VAWEKIFLSREEEPFIKKHSLQERREEGRLAARTVWEKVERKRLTNAQEGGQERVQYECAESRKFEVVSSKLNA